MASISRQDRQLMRQRGAGTRSMTDASFPVSFDNSTAGSRQERQLMRQRGAGTRRINEVDFGVAFPTPNRARRSKTPQNSGRRSRTPARASREPSVPHSTRGLSSAQSHQARRRPNVFDVPEVNDHNDDTPSTVKRRRLNPDTHNHVTDNAPLSFTTGAAGRRRTARNSQITIAEDPEDEIRPQTENLPTPPLTAEEDLSNHDVSKSLDVEDKENGSSAKNMLPPKRNKRRSVGMQSSKWTTLSSPASTPLDTEPLSTAMVVAEEDAPLEADHDQEGDQMPQISHADDVVVAPSTAIASMNPLKRRKKRKSVVLGRTKRRSSDITSQKAKRQPSVSTIISDSGNEGPPDTLSEVASSARPKAPEHPRTITKRPRRSSVLSATPAVTPTRPQYDESEHEDETYIDEDHSSEPPTPSIAPKRRKEAQAPSRQRSKKTTAQPNRRPTSSLPFLTHRLTNTKALPTIHEDPEAVSESDPDDPNAPSGFVTNKTPNAVEVLAQICRENIAVSIAQLDSVTTNNRTAQNRQRSCLEAFRTNLESHLFEMSNTLETRLGLESRLRKSKRDKFGLHARWTEVRRQREDVALRTDAVRRRYWLTEAGFRNRFELSENLYGLELAVGRAGHAGSDQDQGLAGLEYMLRSVAAGVVGGDVGETGLLDRVKEFNVQLERVALGLEGRTG